MLTKPELQFRVVSAVTQQHSLLTNRTKTCHLLYGQFCTRSWWSRQKRSINQMCTFDSRRMNTKRECCPSTEWQLGIVQESIGDLCQATAACRNTASPPCWRMYCHTHNTTLYQLNVFLYTVSRQTYRILNLFHPQLVSLEHFPVLVLDLSCWKLSLANYVCHKYKTKVEISEWAKVD